MIWVITKNRIKNIHSNRCFLMNLLFWLTFNLNDFQTTSACWRLHPMLSTKWHHSMKMGQFLTIRSLYTWLTLIGLHVEVAASRGRSGWGYGGRRGGWGAIAKTRAMDHAALGWGHSVAVARGWATVAAGGKAVGCWGNSRLLRLLHVGMTRAWWHTRTVRAASPRSREVPWYINHEPTFSSSLQEAWLNG